MSLDKFNKQMKIDINEASGISDKCKLKLIKLVEKHFMVDLPNENYLNIDIEILKNNLIWVIIITIAIAIIAIYSLRELFMGNLYGVLWIIIIIGYHVIPATGNSIRNRYMRAHRYIKSLIYKKKK